LPLMRELAWPWTAEWTMMLTSRAAREPLKEDREARDMVGFREDHRSLMPMLQTLCEEEGERGSVFQSRRCEDAVEK